MENLFFTATVSSKDATKSVGSQFHSWKVSVFERLPNVEWMQTNFDSWNLNFWMIANSNFDITDWKTNYKHKFADIQVQFESEAAKVCKAFMAKFPLTQKQTRLLLIETRAKKFNFNPELESEDQEISQHHLTNITNRNNLFNANQNSFN